MQATTRHRSVAPLPLVCAASIAGAAILAVACGRAPEVDRTASPESPAVCALLDSVDPARDHGAVDGRSDATGIAPRAVSSNRITTNRITTNRLTSKGAEGLAGGALEDLAATADGRELLSYAVRCAFRPDQRLELAGDPAIVLEGSLGMAPAWEERPLTAEEERWVSACLLAHVNAFGVSVPFSLRASDLVDADDVERQAFSVHEGAFFGSAASGELYSCHAVAPDRARAESSDRGLRVCTDRGDACAVRSLGSCADVCDGYEDGIGFRDCHAGGVRYAEVVNAHLRSRSTLAACGLD